MTILSGCSVPEKKYELSYYEYFDTLITITYTATDEAVAQRVKVEAESELLRLHRLFDKYNEYDGVTNVYAINQAPGVLHSVDPDLSALINFGKQAYLNTDGVVNIAAGALLDVWHAKREIAVKSPKEAALPRVDELRMAAEHISIDGVTVESDGRVSVESGIGLDLGAIAKGYAADKLMSVFDAVGAQSVIINLGGNVAVGTPVDSRKNFNVGVQNPMDGSVFGVVKMAGQSLVTSGDYQRFFEVDGVRYNHIIDTSTLMPSTKFASVTIRHDVSLTADILSTAAFVLDMEEGKKLVQGMGGEALWIFHDGTSEKTDYFFK